MRLPPTSSLDGRRHGSTSLPCPFVLRLRGRTHALAPGTTILGRDPGADLRLDDAHVSRRHAALRVEGDRVTVEDLGSRNGVLVDGALVARAKIVTHGAVLGLGSERIVLLDLRRRERASTLRPEPVGARATAEPGATTEPGASTVTRSSLAALLVRARAALDPVDLTVLRLVAPLLGELLYARRGLDPALLAEALRTHAACAVELTSATRDPEWLDASLRLHAARGASLHASVASGLVALAYEVRCDAGACRAYLDATSERGGSLSSRELRLASELEALLAALEG